jgi:hypothetical protein
MQCRRRPRLSHISIDEAALTAALPPSDRTKLFSGEVDGHVTRVPSGPFTR